MIDERRKKKTPTLTSDEVRRTFGLKPPAGQAEPTEKKSKGRRKPG